MPTGLERQVGRSVRRGLTLAEQGAEQAPGIGQISGGLDQIMQLLQRLEQERGRVGQISAATPEVQGLAHQAAFAPLQGMQPFLEQALTQASQFAARRGVGRGSISAALQAQAVPQIMEPALAEARGRFAQLLLDVPFRERQLGLQSVGLGGELAGQGAGVLGQQAGVRESAFNQLLQAQARGQEEAQLQRSRRGGLGRLLGGLGGALAGGLLGPIGGQLGSRLGQRLFGRDSGQLFRDALGGSSQGAGMQWAQQGLARGIEPTRATANQGFFVADPYSIQTPGQL